MNLTRNPAAAELERFESRKKSHLDLSLLAEMQASEASAFDSVILEHDALPEIDFGDVNLSTPFLPEFFYGRAKRDLSTPFFIPGMTAGHASAKIVNDRLSRACAKRGWVFGVGSQRRELDVSRPLIDSWSNLKADAPGIALLGNIGISQAISSDLKTVKALVENLGADAFCVHLNALQEVIQPEGTPSFKGGVKALKALVKSLGIPVLVKETGCGFSAKTLEKLAPLGLAAVDVSGLGGTHWGRIEGKRAEEDGETVRATAAKAFKNWGVTTPQSIRLARAILPKTTEVWASGGVRSGLDAAKALSLGATRVGFAKPALEAALAGEATLETFMETVEFELRTALFCTGKLSPANLTASAFLKAKKNGRRK